MKPVNLERIFDPGTVEASPGRWRRKVLRVLVCATLIGCWLLWFLPTGFGGPVGVTWVSGTSMEPGLQTGDLVVTYERDTYEVGDVVSFKIPSGGVIIHRVIEVTGDGSFRFQGDNRVYEDPWELPPESIIGTAVLEVHHAAKIMAFLSRPWVLAVMVFSLVGLWRWQRELNEEEEVLIDLTLTGETSGAGNERQELDDDSGFRRPGQKRLVSRDS